MILFLLILYLIVLSYSMNYPTSPCPSTFTYKQENNLYLGHLSIVIGLQQLPIHVRIHLCLRAVLRSKYAGLIELSQPAEFILGKMKTTNNVNVNYTIRFPIPWPLPTIRTISVNNHIVCEGLQETEGVVTNLFLEHTFPTNKHLLTSKEGSLDMVPLAASDCGTILHKEPFYDEPNLEHWPWLAAILIRKSSALEFHCSGTLISEKVILTAAHCISDKKFGTIMTKQLVIYLGKHNLNKWAEPNSQIRLVHDTALHPDYSPDYFNDDIALLFLSEPAVINLYVRPICLWTPLDDSSIIGYTGIVVGWGKDNSNGTLRMEPRAMHLPIVTQEECLRSRKDFIYITSARTLCAGLRNGTGPCNGDSGSGLMLIRNQSVGMIWELRGVISLSLYDRYNQTCDLSEYLVFTDVTKFIEWIINTMNSF